MVEISTSPVLKRLIVKPSCGETLFSSQWNTVIVNQQDVTTFFLLPPQEQYIYNNRFHKGLREFQDNDTLTFKCIIKEIRESCTAEKSIITIPDYKMKMATDMFTSLYRNSELFDVTFIISDEEIQAHTVVLAAICPYFRKMFSSGMKEQRERTVDFSNDSEITPKVLRGLLDYIYGVKSVEELKDIASDLLILALKFDIADLKTCCEFIVSNRINKTNMASTLFFAHKYDLKILKEKALSISKMHINDLKASKEFEEIYQQVDLVKAF